MAVLARQAVLDTGRGRWGAYVGYALDVTGQFVPVTVTVSLLPVDAAADVPSGRFTVKSLGHNGVAVPADVPPGGLSRRALCSVNLRDMLDTAAAAAGGAALHVLPTWKPGPGGADDLFEEVAALVNAVHDDAEGVSRPRRPGRPPTRSLPEILAILEATEAGHKAGRTLEQVAADRLMSRSSLRNLLSWARHNHEPRLLHPVLQGRSGIELTDEARTMLAALRAQAGR